MMIYVGLGSVYSPLYSRAVFERLFKVLLDGIFVPFFVIVVVWEWMFSGASVALESPMTFYGSASERMCGLKFAACPNAKFTDF